ncbi:MAG: hypothetical protein AB4058_11600, partial [Microcystaceae cyanobacterium]
DVESNAPLVLVSLTFGCILIIDSITTSLSLSEFLLNFIINYINATDKIQLEIQILQVFYT